MRRLIAAFTLLGVLAVPSHAQESVGTSTLRSAGTPVNTPFFDWDIEAFGDDVDLMCIDERHLVSVDDAFQGSIFKINALPSYVLTPLGYSINTLRTVATIYDYVAANDEFEGDPDRARVAQVAIWETMGTRLTGSARTHKGVTDAQFADFLLDVEAFAGPASGDDHFVLLNDEDLTALEEAYLAGETLDSRDITQPQMGRHVTVPEPGTMLLLASGLFIVGAARIRRRGVEV